MDTQTSKPVASTGLPRRPELPETALSRGSGLDLTHLAAAYLREYLDKISIAVGRLDEESVWWRPAPGTNSVGNLLLHLAGNLSMWVLDGLGGQPYERRRSEEFSADHAGDKAELLHKLSLVIAGCSTVIESLDPTILDRKVAIQTYDVDARGALFHAVEHMSYHTGQILWIAKLRLADAGEGFELYPRHRGE